MKTVKRITALLLAAVMLLCLAACSSGPKMSEAEMKAACVAEVENFVGGYLSNSSTNFLKKYTYDPEEELESKKLRFRYTPDWSDGVPERVVDYILEHATFEVDPYSFFYNKETEQAEIAVNVTIIPPVTAHDQIEELITRTYLDVGDEAGNDALYHQAISMISGIAPVTASIPIELYYDDGEWLISNYWMVMIHINEVA